MPRDMELLRDLWQTIDPTCSIGYPSSLTTRSNELRIVEARRKTAKQQEEAMTQYRNFVRLNKEPPAKLLHFLGKRVKNHVVRLNVTSK
jgi:hypothetical protein